MLDQYAYRIRVVYPGDRPLWQPLPDATEAEALDRLAYAVRQHPHAQRVTLVCADGREVDGREQEPQP